MSSDQAICPYILAGGKSSRFGSDKARAESGGEPLICRIAAAVRAFATPIVIADRPGKYADLGLETIGDLTPSLGPLGGLQTALHHCPAEWLLLLSCDLVNLDPDWVEQLLAARQESVDVVAYREGYWEPLCALYHARLRHEVDRRVRERRLAMQPLLNTVRTRALARPRHWAQANTPQELDAAGADLEVGAGRDRRHPGAGGDA